MIQKQTGGDHKFRRIPQPLQELKQWFCWNLTATGEKLPKAVDGTDGKSNDPTTFSDFETATKASQHFQGLAFIIQRDDGLTGVDLDNCLDERGNLRDWAIPVVIRLESVSYAEISPSETGIKFLTYASKTDGARCVHKICGPDGQPLGNKQQIECYDFNRFWCTTGNVYGESNTPRDGQAAIDWLCDTYLSKSQQNVQTDVIPDHRDGPNDLSKRVDAYLEKCHVPAEGDRNNTVFSVAGALKGIVDDHGQSLGDGEIIHRVTLWALPCGLPQNEIESAARSALTNGTPREKKYPQAPVSTTPPNTGGNTGSADADKKTKSKKRIADGEFEPLPLQHLPAVMRLYVESVSRAVGCDPSFVVLPMLSVCAGVIGNARRLLVKRGWFVPPIIWSALIGESGTQKSPPLRAVIRTLKKRQQDQLAQHRADVAEYKCELLAHKRAMKEYEKTGEGNRPAEPQCPKCERCLVSDTTIEGLVPILQDNWRGVILERDELVGWIGGFDKYSKAGKASVDVAHWLSIYNADNIIVDRKTGEPRTLFVPDPAISVCGGIQPGILNRVLSDEHRENGLAARLLMTYPPRKAKQWTDDEIPEAQETALEDLLTGLLSLQPDTGSDGNDKPGIVFLTADARAAFIEYYNRTGQEQAGMSGDLAASWSKLEETAARFALVFHCVRNVTTNDVDPWKCDIDSMAAGIALAEWFKSETARIQSLLTESTEERELRQLAEWVQQRGGRVRAREVVSGRRAVEDVSQADLLLQTLVSAGFGQWRDIPAGETGGRATREFVLNS